MMDRRPWKYILFGAAALALLSVAAATASMARYVKQTEDVSNVFSYAEVIDPSIDESFEGTEKTDVKVSVGETDYPVYVRATIVITWKTTVEVSGETQDLVYFELPKENTDYSLELDLTGKWEEGKDGYYYYKDAVKSGGVTEVLINSCTQLSTAKPPAEGYVLSVEILAQTVQAVGYTDENSIPAYQDAWSRQ